MPEEPTEETERNPVEWISGGHGTEKDEQQRQIKNETERVFFEETSPLSEKARVKKLIREVKDGEVHPENLPFPEDMTEPQKKAQIQSYRNIYNRPDLEIEIERWEEKPTREEREEFEKKMIENFVKGNFEKSIENRRKIFENTQKREDNLIEEIEEWYKEEPEANNAVLLGVAHDHLADRLKEKGIPVERRFSKEELTPPPTQELAAKKSRGEEVDPRTEKKLIADEVICSFLVDYIGERGEEKTTLEMLKPAKKIVNRMELEDIKNLSEHIGKSSDLVPLTEPEKAHALITDWLKKNDFAKEELPEL